MKILLQPLALALWIECFPFMQAGCGGLAPVACLINVFSPEICTSVLCAGKEIRSRLSLIAVKLNIGTELQIKGSI